MRLVCCLIVFAPLWLAFAAAEPNPPPNSIQIATDQIEVFIDKSSGALLSARNRLTGSQKSTRDAPFTIFTDRGIVDSEHARMTGSQSGQADATFRFEAGDIWLELTYRAVSPKANFVEKLLTITNRSPKPLVIDTIVLCQVSFDPAPVQVLFHRAGFVSTHPVISPDVPINLFLRDSGGGFFFGIENPYFGLVRSGARFSLQFQPRWLLSAGKSFTCDPAFLGVYKNEGIYAYKRTQAAQAGSAPLTGAQEILDWGEVWAMQDFMRHVLSPGRPPGAGYPVEYNACGGMENLWRLREAPKKFNPEGRPIAGEKIEISEDEREFVKKFAGNSPWTKEIVHGAFRPAWIEPFKILIDHLASIGQVSVLQPGTLWLGNGGFWDDNKAFIASLDPERPGVEPNPYWLETLRYAQTKGIKLYGFDCAALGYFPQKPEWKYLGSDGKPSGGNCYANPAFVKWHRATLDRAITEYEIPWWQWDEGWADVANGECFASNHGHLPGNVSYTVYRNIQGTTAELRRRHPDIWLVGISALQHHVPWVLRTVNESVTNGDPWYVRNYLFLPPGKAYVGDWTPRSENAEYDFLYRLSLADHLNLAQPVWFADAARRERIQRFWRQWLEWAGERMELFRVRRDLFGPPAPDRLAGSAHILDDRGVLFLFNPGEAGKVASIPLNHWIGLKNSERFHIREIHPLAHDYGVYSLGDDLVVPVDAKQALVLEVAPTSEPRAPRLSPTTATIEKAFWNLKDIRRNQMESDLWIVP